MEKAYNHETTESKIYQQWMDSGYFNPDKLPESESAEPFTIILPPPNVTGTLHLGHAFEDTIQDTLIRFNRMKGKKALWIPGTDHAAIATQARFEKELYKKENKSRHDYDRKTFFNMVHEYALSNQNQILEQLKKMGLSLDWSRLAFTLDKPREKAVRTAFKKMLDAGLIYRAYKIINWDPKGQTTVSDDEVVHEETTTTLYTFKYSKDFPISISTTRPETKVGDTAVAVHPADTRYEKFIGKQFEVEFAGTKLHITVISDENVDPDFGTGALGVTPSHSHLDWEIAEKNNLPKLQIINEFAKMTEEAGTLVAGKKTTEARDIVVSWLREQGLIEKEETVTQNLTKAERTGGIIEPLPKLQWFVNVNKTFTLEKSQIPSIPAGSTTTLKELMQTVVKDNLTTIIPERFEKIYFHWINSLRDWCISRQIIYGHQIPYWYKDNEGYCGIEAPEGDGWIQDTDTLDTWFSSGLWTFSTLGWPDETSDLKMYHPTSIVVPGYEILFFWVARMVLMSTFLLGEVPFKNVYLHGIVRDKQGRKFSKSLNNGIDPLEITSKYGTDALRMALVFGSAAGNDPIFDEQKVKGMKHFANKLWNISRYVLQSTPDFSYTNHKNIPDAKTDTDKEILEKLANTITLVTSSIENFRLHEAAQELYQFTWYEFADVYIEKSKEQLQNTDTKTNTQLILIHTLTRILKLLHPFMPFITEHIWQLLVSQKLINNESLLLIAPWPDIK